VGDELTVLIPHRSLAKAGFIQFATAHLVSMDRIMLIAAMHMTRD
jgi:hypothetical protein